MGRHAFLTGCGLRNVPCHVSALTLVLNARLVHYDAVSLHFTSVWRLCETGSIGSYEITVRYAHARA